MTDEPKGEIPDLTIEGCGTIDLPPAAPLAKTPVSDLPGTRCTSIEVILGQAVQAGRTGAELKELLDVYERMQGAAAVQAFHCAMAKFKAECPPIPRKRKADFATRDGRMTYDYAGLDDIAGAILAALTKCGLTYAWPDAIEEDGKLTVRCEVSHVEGHSTSATFTVPVESKAGMSPQQKYGSAGTYAKRQSLVSALGLTTVDPDDDGRGDVPPETITDKQLAALEAMLGRLKPAEFVDDTRRRMCEFLGVETLADCPANRCDEVSMLLTKKVERQDGT